MEHSVQTKSLRSSLSMKTFRFPEMELLMIGVLTILIIQIFRAGLIFR